MRAIAIEQSSEDVRLAFEVHKQASIASMRLVRAEMRAPQVILGEPLAVDFTYKAKRLDAASGTLALEVAFTMLGGPEGYRGKTRPVMVECAFAVDYALEPGFEPTAAQVKAFKDGNAIFNAWPYFREFLQNTVQRMGLPPLLLPFLRMQPKAATKSK